PGRAVRGRGRGDLARHPRPARRLRRPRLDGLSDVARPGDRRKAVHPRRHHRQWRAGRADVAGGAAPRRLAGRALPRTSLRRHRGDGESQVARRGRAVNGQHFRTFLWLRWRLLVNQIKRGGAANVVVIALLGVAGAALSAVLAVTFFLIGWGLGGASAPVLLY